MDPAIKAVAMIAPVLAPLAVKIIDKLIFEESQPKKQQQQIQGPQIIQVAAPQQCNCRKNRGKKLNNYLKNKFIFSNFNDSFLFYFFQLKLQQDIMIIHHPVAAPALLAALVIPPLNRLVLFKMSVVF